MKKVILIPCPQKDENYRVARQVISRLHSKGAKVYVDRKYEELIWDEVETYTTPPTDADLCVVLGGDGSFLDASPLAIQHQIPMVGINLGRIGFLSVIEPDKLSLLDKIFLKKKVTVEQRILLEVLIRKNNGKEKLFDRLAVNEIAFTRQGATGIAEFSLQDEHGNSIFYFADGMILSTPTGSSAYSLSAGGPLIANEVEAICATPICAHSFFNRPILFGPGAVITLRNNSERNIALDLSLDGRVLDTLAPGEEAEVRVAEKRLLTVEYPNSGMLNTLRRKMEAAELKKNT